MNFNEKTERDEREAASVVDDVAAALSGVPPKWRLPSDTAWAEADVVIGCSSANRYEILKSRHHKLHGKGGRRAISSNQQLLRYLRNLALEHCDAKIVWVLAGNPTRHQEEQRWIDNGTCQWWQL